MFFALRVRQPVMFHSLGWLGKYGLLPRLFTDSVGRTAFAGLIGVQFWWFVPIMRGLRKKLMEAR